MKRFKSAFFVILSFTFLNVHAAKVETDAEKLSYALGIAFGQNIAQLGAELDTPAFLQAIEDTLTNAEIKLSQEEIKNIISDYQTKVQEQQKNQADTNKINGAAYLVANKQKEGVIETASGLQYKIITAGKGAKPDRNSKVRVHYRGTLIDGTEFDSSYARGEPVELGIDQVIQGWQEALPLMPVGSKWQIFVPADLAYGERGAGGIIGPHSTLLFDIELLEIKQ